MFAGPISSISAEIAVGISLFPILREAIILLTAWLLLLPRGFRNGRHF